MTSLRILGIWEYWWYDGHGNWEDIKWELILMIGQKIIKLVNGWWWFAHSICRWTWCCRRAPKMQVPAPAPDQRTLRPTFQQLFPLSSFLISFFAYFLAANIKFFLFFNFPISSFSCIYIEFVLFWCGHNIFRHYFFFFTHPFPIPPSFPFSTSHCDIVKLWNVQVGIKICETNSFNVRLHFITWKISK